MFDQSILVASPIEKHICSVWVMMESLLGAVCKRLSEYLYSDASKRALGVVEHFVQCFSLLGLSLRS